MAALPPWGLRRGLRRTSRAEDPWRQRSKDEERLKSVVAMLSWPGQCSGGFAPSSTQGSRPSAELCSTHGPSARGTAEVPLPPAHARQVRGLLPLGWAHLGTIDRLSFRADSIWLCFVGGLDAEKLCVQDLSDGRLLCALVISATASLEGCRLRQESQSSLHVSACGSCSLSPS